MTREEAWLEFSRREGYPQHDHGPTEAQPRLSTRNYFRQCFEEGWDRGHEAGVAAEQDGNNR